MERKTAVFGEGSRSGNVAYVISKKTVYFTQISGVQSSINAAEKIVFWVGLGVLALVASVSGLILNFPNFDQGRAVMQTAQVVHAVSGVIFIALMLSHIYMGTIGTEGSLEAMRDGTVDERWAKEHHSLWYDEVVRERRRGEAAAGGSLPAGAPAQRL